MSGCLLKVSTDLCLRKCDEGLLVFDKRSGKTSLLNQHGALALRVVSASSLCKETDLRIVLGMDNQRDSLMFDDILSSLENSGLIIRC